MGKQQLTSTTVLIPFLFPSLVRDDDTLSYCRAAAAAPVQIHHESCHVRTDAIDETKITQPFISMHQKLSTALNNDRRRRRIMHLLGNFLWIAKHPNISGHLWSYFPLSFFLHL